MNAESDNPMDVGKVELETPTVPLRWRQFVARWARSVTLFVVGVVLAIWTAGSCPAMDQPPRDFDQQRAWLVGHLVTDMEALGTFDGNALAKVPAIVNNLTDDQVALLAQYYFLTRSKTEQDASLYAMQQQGYAEEQVNSAKAEIADLLTTMNDQIEACYQQFVPMPQPVLYLAQVCYASVPGWCCHARCFVPEWYYDNGCFVGPCFDAGYAGFYAAPVYRAYYDHGSRFYGRYHNVANTVYTNHSMNLARCHADWIRHHGDWKSVMAHDRLLHQSSTGYRNQPPRIVAGAKNHAGNRAMTAHKPASYAGSKQHHPNSNNVAQHQKIKPQGKHASAARPPKVQHQAAKAHTNLATTGKPSKAQHYAMKPRASHASAPNLHTARPAPKPQSHAARPQHTQSTRPQPQHATHAQPKSGHKRQK